MSSPRKAVTYVLGGIALWLIALVIFGFAYSGRAGRKVAERVGHSLMAETTIESSSLAMVRGHLELENLHARHSEVGELTLDVGHIRCDLLPLGLALVDRVCRDLVVDKVRLEVSSAAVFKLKKPKKKPFHVERVEINDAVLVFSPSAFVPELGKIEIKVDHVEAGPTTFKTPLSWMFSMRELRATLDLPAGIVVKLHYKDRVLTAAGGIFGSTPVQLPLELPVADAADDAQAEIAKLVQMGRTLAEQLVAKRAQDWLKSKLF